MKETTKLSRKQRANFAKEELARYLEARANAGSVAPATPVRRKRKTTLQPRVAVQCYSTADLRAYEASIREGSIRGRRDSNRTSSSSRKRRREEEHSRDRRSSQHSERRTRRRVGEYTREESRSTRPVYRGPGEFAREERRRTQGRAERRQEEEEQEEGEEEEGPLSDRESETFEQFLNRQREFSEEGDDCGEEGWEGEDPQPAANSAENAAWLNEQFQGRHARRREREVRVDYNSTEYIYDSEDDLD